MNTSGVYRPEGHRFSIAIDPRSTGTPIDEIALHLECQPGARFRLDTDKCHPGAHELRRTRPLRVRTPSAADETGCGGLQPRRTPCNDMHQPAPPFETEVGSGVLWPWDLTGAGAPAGLPGTARYDLSSSHGDP